MILNRNEVDRYHYDSWGVSSFDLEAVKQPLLYAGYFYDLELGAPEREHRVVLALDPRVRPGAQRL